MARDFALYDEDDDADEHEHEDAHHGVLGLWASALFNLCALVLPLAGAYACQLVMRERLFSYEASASAGSSARGALERIASRLPPASADRAEFWDDRVADALFASDIQAARGTMLLAPAILGRSLTMGDDAALEAAALAQLTPGTRARYEATVPLLARINRDAMPRPPGSFAVMDDTHSFDDGARAELAPSSAGRDHLAFVLIGMAGGRGGVLSNQEIGGLSIVQGAISARRLSPSLRNVLNARAEGVVPAARFRSEAQTRLSNGMDQTGAYDEAFRAAIDAQTRDRMEHNLAVIGQMGEAAGAQGALTLLAHAQNEEDLQRLALLAQTQPDRAIAVARMAPADAGVAQAGHGALAFTPELAVAMGIALLSLFAMLSAAGTTAAQALAGALHRQWRPPEHSRHDAGGELYAHR